MQVMVILSLIQDAIQILFIQYFGESALKLIICYNKSMGCKSKNNIKAAFAQGTRSYKCKRPVPIPRIPVFFSFAVSAYSLIRQSFTATAFTF
jgi:hypothetical protein